MRFTVIFLFAAAALAAPMISAQTAQTAGGALPQPVSASAPASGAAPAAPVPGTSPAAQTVKLTAAAPASAPAAEQPSDAATVKLKSGSTGKTTLKLSLQKPSGTQTAVAENGQLKVPELTLPGKEETAEKPSVVFLLISIAAMLAVVFTVLLMSVQFANMYHGANVNIPGMTRLSGTR